MVHDLPKLHSGRTGARLALRPAALGGGFWTLPCGAQECSSRGKHVRPRTGAHFASDHNPTGQVLLGFPIHKRRPWDFQGDLTCPRVSQLVSSGPELSTM